jgi:electron transport complex protein RnfC
MLLPQQLYWYSHTNDLDKAQEYNLFDCIECGCCSYVCPSNIPLVQYYRYAKGAIWTNEREKEQADIARQRHESRQDRLTREKVEREARRQQKKAALASHAGKAPPTEDAIDKD